MPHAWSLGGRCFDLRVALCFVDVKPVEKRVKISRSTSKTAQTISIAVEIPVTAISTRSLLQGIDVVP